MAKRNYFIIFLVVIFGVAVLTRISAEADTGGNGAAGGIFRFPFDVLEALFRAPAQNRAFQRIKLENEDLRAQILAREQEPRESPGGDRAVVAPVFSSYPFNNQSLLAVAAGSRHGIRRLAPVTVGSALFLGQVVEVYDRMSLVRTVFDPDWQLPVKIGDGRSDALFTGGKTPALSLIVHGEDVKEGNAVYTAHRDFPYGLTVGRVMRLRSGPDPALKVADVELPFALREVQDVSIHPWP